MTDNLKTQELIEEMRSKGNLPAINENVQAITQITHQSHTRAVDLATVIMRDCGLTSNISATANSVMYRPRYPIKTVTYAVTFLGFEKVRSLALGLSMFNQTMKTAKTQQLGQLYASSYFSGAFASSLAAKNKADNPEEIFVAGLLYRLPWLALANTFFNKSKTMMTGRFYAGKDTRLKAEDFKISMIDNSSPIVKSINNKETAVFNLAERSFQISLLKNQSHFKTAMISPIMTKDLVIGTYFAARANDIPFSEKEIAWFEQIVLYVGQAFENSKK